MKIAIVGSRKYLTQAHINDFIALLDDSDIVVSGRSPGGGVDLWAEQAADARGLGKKIFPVDYNVVNSKGFRTAAMIRNWEIAQECDRLIAFWDMDSTGTSHGFMAASLLGKRTCIITADMTPAAIDEISKVFLWRSP